MVILIYGRAGELPVLEISINYWYALTGELCFYLLLWCRRWTHVLRYDILDVGLEEERKGKEGGRLSKKKRVSP